MITIQDIIEQRRHNAELVIRGLNRRLESWGKVLYTPAYYKDRNMTTHLEQYNELVNKLYTVFHANYISPGSDNIIGRKGEFIQISRGKDSIDALLPIIDELQKILDTTQTWQEAKDEASKQAGRKLTRKEALSAIKVTSTIMRMGSIKQFLGESEKVGSFDQTLEDLLKPFRSPSKGGTRRGPNVAQSDFDALASYLRSSTFLQNMYLFDYEAEQRAEKAKKTSFKNNQQRRK